MFRLQLFGVVLALAVIGCGRVGFANLVEGGEDVELTRRNQIVVRGSVLTESVSEFPLYVTLRAPAVDLAAIAADGADLRFHTDDEETLPYEIERKTADSVDVWVRVPQIEKGVDERINVTYGNPAAPPGAKPEEVWKSGFIAVWHLVDGHDSTANHLDGVFTGTQPRNGIAGGAREMQLGYMAVANAPALAQIGANGTATWSAWAHPTSIPMSVTALIDRQTDGTMLDDFRFGPTSYGTINGEMNLDPGLQSLGDDGGTYPPDSWNLYAMVRDPMAMHVGINGMTVESKIGNGTIHPSANPVWIGGGCNGCGATPTSDNIEGGIDEARIESVARGDGWLYAEYQNLIGTLVVVEPFEVR